MTVAYQVVHGLSVRGRARLQWPATVAAAAAISAATALTAGAAAAPGQGGPARLAPVGAAPAIPPGARALGPVPETERLRLTLTLRPRDPGAMARLARQVATPGSGHYRHFLRPGQVRARFGASQHAISALRTWLRRTGLRAGPATADGLLLPAIGTVARVERAFGTPIVRVRLPGGRVAHANSRPARLPAALRRWVTGVVGLDDLAVPQPYLDRPGEQSAVAASPGTRSAAGRDSRTARLAGPGSARLAGPGSARLAGPGSARLAGHGHAGSRSGIPVACRAARQTPAAFTAGQIARAYGFDHVYRRGFLGHGVTVALFELADYANSDIATYARCYGIQPVIRRVKVDGGTTVGASGKAVEEITADIETVAGMAPRARILVYEAPGSSLAAVLDNYGAIVQQDRAQVVSSSYGYCEPLLLIGHRDVLLAEAGIFAGMALQGQSMLAASGDAGSEQCLPLLKALHGLSYRLAVGDPASQPYVTGVGGTAVVRYGSPPGERAWNQTGPHGDGRGFRAPFDGRPGRPRGYPGNLAGNGGISIAWRMPPWQRGFDTSANASGTPCGALRGGLCREVPDVSALAAAAPGTPGYAIYGTPGPFRGKGWIPLGGTSLATPLWAALTALADQQVPRHRLGLLSPALYRVDRTDPAAFGDVRRGGNDYLARGGVPANDSCRYGGRVRQPCYQATKGYDMATGLGSPRAGRLTAALASLADVG